MQRILAGIPFVVAAAMFTAPANAATVPTGPAGLDFYKPPGTLPNGHGAAIQVRKLTGAAVLKSAKSNRLLLYRSTSADGGGTAVSGTVAIPKGTAPKGGWPVITWAHGTTGIADACAPSIAGTQASYDSPLLNRWLKAGFAVVRTDYEGLGTPTTHPYLNGVSEGRSMLDMVRAARKLDAKIGKRVVIAGHSQGGQAALWAASIARKWTPELTIRGTLAFAPVSHLGEQGALLSSLTQPTELTGLAAMIVRGVDVSTPSLNVGTLLSEKAKALYPQVDEVCLGDLRESSSFGGLAPAELFAPGVDVSGLIAVLSANDPETLKLPGPVRIEQGRADTTVFQTFTDQLTADLKGRGADVTYKTYAGVDHGGVVIKKAPADDATKFVESRR